MSNTGFLKEGAKVVISPDEMRAWIMLPPPDGQAYSTAELEAWLHENGVVYGISPALLEKASVSQRYHELLEVAQGKEPLAGEPASYTLHIDPKPFTGLQGNPDGSLYYDDLSFLQVAEENQILAEIHSPTTGVPGINVKGEEVAPREAEGGKTLEGNGFVVTDDGRYYRAPSLSHVNMVNNKLMVTPLLVLESLSEQDSAVEFNGNVFVEKDLHPNSAIKASGSVFIGGRVSSGSITAGRNILVRGGVLGQSGFSHIKAKENVWGLFFEGSEIVAGNDFHTNHLSGCEVTCNGKAAVLGGRGAIINTTLYAKNGVICSDIGAQNGDKSYVSAGMDKDIIDRFENLEQRINKVNNDVQVLQQNITAFERVNRSKPDKGRKDPSYKEMLTKKGQSLSVLNIITAERTRVKRQMDQYSNVSIVARNNVYPGVTIEIDTRTMPITKALHKVKFRRDLEAIKVVISSGR